jgi:glycosyltransferase involved in cell wall biosynthesis
MPKVLRIINRFNLGGPTYNAAYLTKFLPENFETLLVGGMKDESEDSSQHILDSLGISPLIIPEMMREVSFREDKEAYNKICDLIKEFKPDIIHTHASKPGTLGRLAGYNLKVPIIIHTYHGHVFHSYFNWIKTNFYKAVERNLAKKSSCIIAISDNQKDELANIHKICLPEKIKVIPLGFDLDRFHTDVEFKRKEFRAKYNISEDEVAIGIVGRLVPIKNHSMFLKAIKFVSERSSKKIRAFIVGDGEERSNIENLANQLKIPFSKGLEKINEKPLLIFTSWIKKVDEINAAMDIIALTSKNEGTPVSLIEAQASNKPIVTTNVGGIENVVIPGRTALLSETFDDESFALNLLFLVENENVRKKFGEHGFQFVKDKFHYKRLVNDISKLYQDLLNSQVH